MLSGRPSAGTCSLALLVISVAFVTSCGGDQGDNDDADCQTTPELISDENVADAIGTSATEALHWAARRQTVDARWIEPNGLKTATGSGDTMVTFEVRRAKGSAALQDTCGTKTLAVPITLSIETDVLSSSLETTLQVRNEDLASASVRVPARDARPLALMTASKSIEVWTTELLVLLTPDASAGTLTPRLQEKLPSGLSEPAGDYTVLHWPAGDRCERETVRGKMASELDWMSSVAKQTASSWVGDIEGVASYRVSIDVDRNSCIDLDAAVTVPTVIQLEPIERGMAIRLEGYLEAGSGGAKFVASGYQRLGGKPAEFVEMFGDFGEDVSEYEDVELGASLAISASDANGAVRVTGYTNDCKPKCTDTSCEGCGPSGETRLVEIALHPAP